MTYFVVANSLVTPHLVEPFAAASWLIANVSIAVAAWRASRGLFPSDTFLELVGHTILFVWASIIAVSYALSSIGLLSGWALLAVVTVTAITLLVFVLKRPAVPVLFKPDVVICLILWSLLYSIWIGHVITQGLLVLPADWDSLAYHLPLVDQWLQTHTLWTTGCARWANPGNNELLALWIVGPFTGDFLSSLNNLPVAALLACSSVGVASRLGLTPTLSHLAGFAIVCNLVVFKQLVDSENDVAVAACFFAAFAYAIRYSEERKLGALVLGAISLGILFGIKYYAIGYCVIVLSIWVLLTALAQGPKASVCVLCASSIGLIVFGGFWYIRNWLMTGTPLYPKDVLGHPDLLSQIYPDVATTSFFGNHKPQLFELYANAIWHMTGPCQLLAFFLTPASFVWLLGSATWYAIRRYPGKYVRIRLATVMALAGTAFFLGVTPFAVEDQPGTLNQLRWHYCPVRYGLCFLGSAVLAMLVILQDFILPKPAEKQVTLKNSSLWSCQWLLSRHFIFYLVVGVAIVFQIPRDSYVQPIQWTNDLLIALNIGMISLCLALIKKITIWIRLTTFLAIMTGWAFTCTLLSSHWHDNFNSHYDKLGFSHLDNLQQKEPGRHSILVLMIRCYPYFGSQRQHHVYQPTYVPYPDWIMEFLHKGKANYIAADYWIQPTGIRRFIGFDECFDRYPGYFRQIGAGTLYQVSEIADDNNPIGHQNSIAK